MSGSRPRLPISSLGLAFDLATAPPHVLTTPFLSHRARHEARNLQPLAIRHYVYGAVAIRLKMTAPVFSNRSRSSAEDVRRD